MSLTQLQAIDVVLRERRYQDEHFNPEENRSSGLTRAQEHALVTTHLAMMKTYLDDAFNCWTLTKPTQNAIPANRTSPQLPFIGSTAALAQVAKIAAMAIRCLERVPGSEYLLTDGLR